jgi:multidrug resistance efflux pump
MRLACVGVVALFGCGRAGDDQTYQGVVEFEERVLGFEIGGRLRSVAVERGSLVFDRAVLATLDDSLLRPTRDARAAELRAAEAALALLRAGSRTEEVRATASELQAAEATEKQLERSAGREHDLAASGATSQTGLEDADTSLTRARSQRAALAERLQLLRSGARPEEVAAAQARVEGARAVLAAEEERLGRTALRAPQAGRVLDVHARAGEVVAAGAPVVTLADTRHPYVDVFVPQGRTGGLRLGGGASVRVDAETRSFPARIEDIGRKTEFTPKFLFSDRERPSLVIRVRVRVDDPKEALHAGVPAFVSFQSP